jgi:hypothetical protein
LPGQAFTGGATTVQLTGQDAYYNSFTQESYTAFDASVRSGNSPATASALLVKANPTLVKPEQVQAMELGYRTIFKDFSLDINGYYNSYKDFISVTSTYAPLYGTVGTSLAATALANGDSRRFNVYTNSQVNVNSIGVGVGISRKVYKNFELGGSYNYSQIDFDQSADPSFQAGFNTPKHRIKGTFGNDKLTKHLGFNTNVRYNSAYLWESTFIIGMVPENVVFDAQINYAIPVLKSVIKIGGANIAGKDYIQVLGAGSIGRQYYASWTINP